MTPEQQFQPLTSKQNKMEPSKLSIHIWTLNSMQFRIHKSIQLLRKIIIPDSKENQIHWIWMWVWLTKF